MTAVKDVGVYVIAEAGVNHNGDEARAMALVDAAAEAGADAVKFQSFRADAVAIPSAPKAAYQEGEPGTQADMLRALELSEETQAGLVAHCSALGIDFLSTPFDRRSLRFLTRGLGLKTLKMASGEITNGPLLLDAARSGCAVLLSTGMSTMEEIAEALGVLAFGFTQSDRPPSARGFGAAFASPAGRRALAEKVVLLQCTSEYPAPPRDVNLRAMDTLSEAFGLPVGLSDHSQGTAIAIAAVGRGAVVIEKHLTLDRGLPGPDHKASLEPRELAELVGAIRAVEAALGDGVKRPMPSESANRPVVRKSLVAAAAVPRGRPFSEETLAVKRPGTGLSPMRYWEWLGKPAGRDYAEDEALDP